MGAGSVEGSTDTDLDPYDAHKGLFWSHMGWMLFKPRRKPGVADVSDLTRSPVVRWQHKNYLWLMLVMAFVLPTFVCGLGWGDWKGGYVYAGVVRLIFVHHVGFVYLPLSFKLTYVLRSSQRFASTLWHTGLGSHRSMTNTLPVTT
jgi:fatty-acid desaturase